MEGKVDLWQIEATVSDFVLARREIAWTPTRDELRGQR